MLRLSTIFLLSLLDTTTPKEDARVKALFMYKFMQTMEWPEGKSQEYYQISVVGDVNLLNELQGVTAGKSLNKKEIRVVNYTSDTDLKDINIIFLSQNLSDLFPDFYQLSLDNSVLLVTESSGLARKGAGVNFYQKGEKIRFEMNLATLEKSQINTSRSIRDIAKLVK